MKTDHPLSRSFIRLYLLSFCFFSANSILTVILPLRSDAQGIGETEIGLMMGAYMLTCLLLRPWAGQTVAKYGALQAMRTLLLLHAAVLILYAVSGVETYLPLRALQGAVTAFFSMAMQIGLVDTLPERERAQGLSLYTLSTMLPQLFGPMTALYIWEQGQPQIFTAGMIFLAIFTWLCGLSVPLPSSSTKGQSYTFIDLMKSGKQLWTHRALRICSAVMLLGAAVFGSIMTFLPLYLEREDRGNAGLYLMIQGAVVVLCRFALRKKIPSDGRWNASLIAGLLLLFAAGSQALAWLPVTDYGLYPAAVCNGIAIALLYPTLLTYLTFVLPAESRNLLIGLFISSYDLGFSLGGFLMGALADLFSYSAIYVCCTFLSIAAFAMVIGNRNGMPTTDETDKG
ncbi:MFS transporter [Cohnella sp. CFH 77786]|uniref:staphylopine family metallophore export MFS transporter CntE n=1 Tax=Cohnella sp. CFH 77786 TaxID=2662265 RepID=UPI001C60D9F3|nr:MFS transporter [Cohnella sp. CFH 77786]MBW5447704.1 MFS transporter [Cohnella sp. CFH 77786]